MTDEAATDTPAPRQWTRDYEALRGQLDAWLQGQLPADAEPRVSALVVPESNGMSSDTVLFDLSVVEDGERVVRPCVARLAPEDTATPVFPSYDFPKQFRVIRLVAERTAVPVPPALWLEPDSAAVGSPFFVMARIEGQVPPDVMPYTFGDNWLADASPEDQRKLQDSTVRALAALHEVDTTNADLTFLEFPHEGDTALRRHVNEIWSYYEWVAGQGVRQPLIERCFAWMDENWPDDTDTPVLLWGDARIGNVLYRDFEPAGVLDWEMAATGPREIDLGWMMFLHRFFQDLTEQMALPGLPDFMRRDDVVATYEQASGVQVRDPHFYMLYAALRHGIIMSRIQQRQIAAGEGTMPDDPDDMIMHRATLEQMIDGTYWSKL
jgi:aminoglycoside phosphotransferase (APT) family kinase protein